LFGGILSAFGLWSRLSDLSAGLPECSTIASARILKHSIGFIRRFIDEMQDLLRGEPLPVF
jgi:hypothetical protein